MANRYEIEGTVVDVLGNNFYKVDVEVGGETRTVLSYMSGKMRQHKISIIVGDRVKIDLPEGGDKARIVFRDKG